MVGQCLLQGGSHGVRNILDLMVQALKLLLMSAQGVVDRLDGILRSRRCLANLSKPLVELALQCLDFPRGGLQSSKAIFCRRCCSVLHCGILVLLELVKFLSKGCLQLFS